MASSSDNPSNGSGSGIQWNWSGDDMKIDRSAGPSGPPKTSQLKSSRAHSIATPAMDKSRREPLKASNPGSIPTAGGRALGANAREERERRKSQMSSDMGFPPLDKEGSPDPVTQNNTAANTIPARMNDGEGKGKVEEEGEARPGSAPPPAVQVEDADAKNDATTAASASAAKENTTPTTDSTGRRGSTMDVLKGKLGLGKKK